MRYALLCLLILFAVPASAQVEARSVALLNSCKPTKIEVLSQIPGPFGATNYSVTCEKKGNASEAPSLRITCRNRQCYVTR